MSFTSSIVSALRGAPPSANARGASQTFPIAPEMTMSSVATIADVIEQFENWVSKVRSGTNPWSEFGELVRGALHQCCGATLVTPYRVTSNGKELRAMRDADSLVQTDRVNTRKGIVGHVFTTGRTYVAGDASNGEMIETLSRDAEHSRIAWCFVTRHGSRRIGLVTAGHFAEASRALLPLAERLISLFWQMTCDVDRTRTLEQCDPVCGLLSRPAFLESSESALAETYRQNAPAAVAVLSLEGLRAMNDSGRWEVADDLLREVSRFLQAKVRGEDRLGRFDGSRFVILLRCVDSELATLIVRQIIAQLSTVCGDMGRWGAPIKIRCGLAGSGAATPSLRDLVSNALMQMQRARDQNRLISSDILDFAEAGKIA